MMKELFELIARHHPSAKRPGEEDGAAIMKRVQELLALEKPDGEKPSTELEDDESSG